MTDRIHSLTVVLEKDMRDDDCESLISAIRMLRNVLSVEPHVTDFGDHTARERARCELGEKLWEVLHPPSEKK